MTSTPTVGFIDPPPLPEIEQPSEEITEDAS